MLVMGLGIAAAIVAVATMGEQHIKMKSGALPPAATRIECETGGTSPPATVGSWDRGLRRRPAARAGPLLHAVSEETAGGFWRLCKWRSRSGDASSQVRAAEAARAARVNTELVDTHESASVSLQQVLGCRQPIESIPAKVLMFAVGAKAYSH